MSDLSKPCKFRRDYNVILQRCKRFWGFLWSVERIPGTKFDDAMQKLENAIFEEAKTYEGNRTLDGLRLKSYQNTTKVLNNTAAILIEETVISDPDRAFALENLLRTIVDTEICFDAVSTQKSNCQEAKEKVWIDRNTRRPISQISHNDIRTLAVNVVKSKNLKKQFEDLEKRVNTMTESLF